MLDCFQNNPGCRGLLAGALQAVRVVHWLRSGMLVALCFSLSCREPVDSWSDPQFKREYVAEHRKSDYVIPGSSASLKDAIQLFANSLASGGQAGLLTEREFKEIYWPNFPDRFVFGPGMNPDAAWTMEQTDRNAAMPVLFSLFQGKSVRVAEIRGGRQAEQYHAIRVHFPGDVVFEEADTGRRFQTDLIYAVIEHRRQFKVVRVGPD